VTESRGQTEVEQMTVAKDKPFAFPLKLNIPHSVWVEKHIIASISLTLVASWMQESLKNIFLSASENLIPTNRTRLRATRDNLISTIEDCEILQADQTGLETPCFHICAQRFNKTFLLLFLCFLGKLGKSL
jgi:hypothetical protein